MRLLSQKKRDAPSGTKLWVIWTSLARMNLGPWVCEHGYLNNYLPGYGHDLCYNVKDTIRFLPVEGKSYRMIKYEGPVSGGCWFIPTNNIIYHGTSYSEEELLRMNNLWRIKGYYGVREFYQPDEIDMLSALPDARNTLLWSPSVVTDEQGEATLSFYCSDVNTAFTGRIEGVGNAGLLGVATVEFRVLKIPALKKEGEE
jgi:hypothetical protein